MYIYGVHDDSITECAVVQRDANERASDVLDIGKKRNSGMGSYRKFLFPAQLIPLPLRPEQMCPNALRHSHAGGKQVA